MHCTSLQLQLPYTRLHYTILRYTTQHNATRQHAELHYTNCTTPRLEPQLHLQINQLHYITATALLHYTTATTATTTALHHTTSSSCGRVTAATMATTPKNTTPTTCRCISGLALPNALRDSRQPTSPIGFLFLKLPPPPCASLLVLYTLHSTLDTVHSSLHTLYTPHSTRYTLHSTLPTPHFALHSLLHSTVYSALVR